MNETAILDAAKITYELPPLPYAYDALEPYIDQQTMHVHHDKHHQAYLTNLIAALDRHPELKKKAPDELLRGLNTVPEDIRTAVRNHGGGHVHHSIFWTLMKPKGGGEPSGKIAGIIREFGGFEAFKTKFNDAGLKHFGSGWAWLVRNSTGKHEIITTPNQDSPFSQSFYPIMVNDVWEHAYYLKYQNRRADYLQAWWNIVNWDEINRRIAASEKT
jgi:Fe-Mn family superoxide dismutase